MRAASAPVAREICVSATAAGCGNGTSLRESASATRSWRAWEGVRLAASLSGRSGRILARSGSSRLPITLVSLLVGPSLPGAGGEGLSWRALQGQVTLLDAVVALERVDAVAI